VIVDPVSVLVPATDADEKLALVISDVEYRMS
jgi:hypothetical protein